MAAGRQVPTKDVDLTTSEKYKNMLERIEDAHQKGSARLQQLDAAKNQLRDQLIALEGQIQLLQIMIKELDTPSELTTQAAA